MNFYLHLIWHNTPMTKYSSEYIRVQILNFQNTFVFDSACGEIRLENRTEIFFVSLIPTSCGTVALYGPFLFTLILVRQKKTIKGYGSAAKSQRD